MLDLDARLKPPEILRAHFKHWQKASARDLDESKDILDFERDHLRSDSSLPTADRVGVLEKAHCDSQGLEVAGMPGTPVLETG